MLTLLMKTMQGATVFTLHSGFFALQMFLNISHFHHTQHVKNCFNLNLSGTASLIHF